MAPTQPEPIAKWNKSKDCWEYPTEGQLFELSVVYSEIFPRSGMTRSGTAYSLPTSGHPTPGSESSSLLPTPDAYKADRGGSQHPEKRRAGGHSPYLASVAEWLLTERE